MKNWKYELFEGTKPIAVFISVLALIFLILGGLINWINWQEQRNKSHEIAVSKVRTFISADSGYYVTRETLTRIYGSGDTVTTISLHFIPAKDNTFFRDSTIFTSISVWDYNADGNWDKMFICGYPNDANGCNAIVFNGELEDWKKWEWDPCPADKGMKPFDGNTVAHIVQLIKQAS